MSRKATTARDAYDLSTEVALFRTAAIRNGFTVANRSDGGAQWRPSVRF